MTNYDAKTRSCTVDWGRKNEVYDGKFDINKCGRKGLRFRISHLKLMGCPKKKLEISKLNPLKYPIFKQGESLFSYTVHNNDHTACSYCYILQENDSYCHDHQYRAQFRCNFDQTVSFLLLVLFRNN